MDARVQGVVTQGGVDISALINAEAQRLGGPPRLLAALLLAESDLDEHARRPTDPARDLAQWPDVSFGLGQQTVKYATAFGLGDGSPNPENIANVGDQLMHNLPLAIQIAARQVYAYWQQTQSWQEACARYNGGPRAQWATIPAGNQANYQRAWGASARYLSAEDAAMQYDADTPVETQRQSWSCSIRSVTWCLKSLGIATDAATMQDAMVGAGLVSPEQGLLDGSGGALAAFLREGWGLTVEHMPHASWAGLQACAGSGPIALGGHGWNHWVAVRRRGIDEAHLAIMNPADGWMGVHQLLSSSDFDRLGPFSALYVPVGAAPAPAPTPPPAVDPRDNYLGVLRTHWLGGLDEQVQKLRQATGVPEPTGEPATAPDYAHLKVGELRQAATALQALAAEVARECTAILVAMHDALPEAD